MKCFLLTESVVALGLTMYHYETIIQVLTDTASLEKDSAELQSECMVVMELIQKCVNENASAALDQEEYQGRYDALVKRYDTAKSRLEALIGEKQARFAKRESIMRFIDELKKRDTLLSEFDEELFCATVESVRVFAEKSIFFRFKDGGKVILKV